nr:hypothetical protein [uncultured bacterium]
MKKTAVFALILFALTTNNAFGQMMLNLKEYSSFFQNSNGRLDRPYLRATTDEDFEKYMILGGNETSVDTSLEIALLSYYSEPVRNIRPTAADAILPANNPRLADQKLGAAVFQEIQILRFLNDTAAVNRHEAVLRFITDRGNVTRQEVEAFYRNNIRALISDVVDEEINKIIFSLSTDTDGCTASLIKRGNQYDLICNGYWGNPKVNEVREFSGTSLDNLIRNMQTSRSFSEETSVYVTARGRRETYPTYTYLREQAAMLPITVPTQTVTYIKESLTNFFLTPNQTNFNTIRSIYRNSDSARDLEKVYNDMVSHQSFLQDIGRSDLARDYTDRIRTAQNRLNEIRRQFNVSNNAQIEWNRLFSAYYRVLDSFNQPELFRRIQAQ